MSSLPPRSSFVRTIVLVSVVGITTLVQGQNNDNPFTLRLFDTGTEALCLDGTRAGYYISPGNGAMTNTWLIENEGGGWCISDADCYARSMTDIGSSKNWPATGCPGMDGGANGIFSNDCTENPYFCNATKVHMNYCDGASFAGYRTDPIVYNNTNLYFRGRAILDETLNYLLTREGMNNANAVLFKGCSAGGASVVIHTDYVANVLKAHGIVMVSTADAGVFLNHNNTQNQPSYTPLYQNVAAMQNVTPFTNDACVAYYTPTNETWKCFMGQYVIPFLTTPVFFSQDLSDSWQLSNIYELGCSPSAGNPGNCNPTQMQYLYQYALDFRQVMAAVFNSTLHGGFFTNCVQHCHANINYCFNGALVQNQTMQTTFEAWYQWKVHNILPPSNVLTTVVDGVYGSNPTCTSSCSPYRTQKYD